MPVSIPIDDDDEAVQRSLLEAAVTTPGYETIVFDRGETVLKVEAARGAGSAARLYAGDVKSAPFGILRALDERGNVRTLAEVESEMIRLAIDHYQGRMSEVARRLGIGRSTLYRKLKDYGIDLATDRPILQRNPQFIA